MKLRQIQPDYYILEDEDQMVIATSCDTDKFGHKLLLENCDKLFNIVDVNELANSTYRDYPDRPLDKDWTYNQDTNAPRKRKAFIKGFNKALDLNKDKLFTIEQMEESIIKAWNIGFTACENTINIGNSIDINVTLPIMMHHLKCKEIDVEIETIIDNNCLILKKINP